MKLHPKHRHELKRKAERKIMHKMGYNSEAYARRKDSIRREVLKKEAIAHAKALERKAREEALRK